MNAAMRDGLLAGLQADEHQRKSIYGENPYEAGTNEHSNWKVGWSCGVTLRESSADAECEAILAALGGGAS